MDKNELLVFADHLRDLCMDCQHCPPKCYPSACNNNTCYLHSVRNLHKLFKDKPALLEQLIVKNRRPEPKEPDSRPGRGVSIR